MTSALLMIKEVVSYMNGCVLKKGLFHHSAEVATEDVNIINVGSRSRMLQFLSLCRPCEL